MGFKKKRIVKQIGLGLSAVLVIVIVVYWDLIRYGLQQAKGQLTIIYHARPVEEFLNDPDFPDSLKSKLILIQEVRRFAIDSLGLKDTENYKTLYDQKGEEIMWVVTASEPFRLEAIEWRFPVLGSVPYKGFFIKEEALKEKMRLEKDSFDVSIRNPGGWSTLGWFTDPILSKMLERSEGDLANLIIHEMSHATIFVKDSIDFNENLASFIGDRGAEQFLIAKYGKDSPEWREYLQEDIDYQRYVDHFLRGADLLDSLYETMNDDEPYLDRRRRKYELIEQIVLAMDTLEVSGERNVARRVRRQLPNNAFFMNYRRYQAKQDLFSEEFYGRFNGNLRAYIQYLADKYPFL